VVNKLIDDSPFGRVPAEAEKAYRRGFMQGAAIALDAVESGAPMSQVSDWVYVTLAAWRRKATDWKPRGRVKAVPPPAEPCGAVKSLWQRFVNRVRREGSSTAGKG
jgi:hypothetical protein